MVASCAESDEAMRIYQGTKADLEIDYMNHLVVTRHFRYTLAQLADPTLRYYHNRMLGWTSTLPSVLLDVGPHMFDCDRHSIRTGLALENSYPIIANDPSDLYGLHHLSLYHSFLVPFFRQQLHTNPRGEKNATYASRKCQNPLQWARAMSIVVIRKTEQGARNVSAAGILSSRVRVAGDGELEAETRRRTLQEGLLVKHPGSGYVFSKNIGHARWCTVTIQQTSFLPDVEMGVTMDGIPVYSPAHLIFAELSECTKFADSNPYPSP
ncbi:hypothetical protein ARMSODRAFT_1034539 [Armillaria solidipes]|uniref:Uncharacterized protein n=1 Tax=Armillaria solidipes TaxID=1076256 RepID=A0A2H3B206_9AGAR|nr:hypothetical protein ARMSODRAFT_1034539 [Armillaria solidipes]